MHSRVAPWLILGALWAGAGAPRVAARDVTTFHYDVQRTGWNSEETTLRPDNVSPTSFGKLWYAPLDGQVYGEPLVVTALQIEGQTHDVLFAGTENNSVYALDAATGSILWQNHVATALSQAQFEQPIGAGACPNINPLHGITGTPVIDPTTKTLYSCSLTMVNGQQTYELFALDIATGHTLAGWPVALKGSFKGLTFRGTQNTQRGALTLIDGTVFVPFSSRCDVGEWHGWLFGIPVAGSHAPLKVFTTSPNGYGSGMWGSGGATSDGQGHLYVVTGNGDFNLAQGGDDLGQSMLRLSAADLSFSKATKDYSTPLNYDALNNADLDIGGSSAIVLPDHAGSKSPHLLVTGGKDGVLYLVDRDNMGGVGAELDRVRMFAPGDASVVRTTPVCFVSPSAGYFVYIAPEPYGGLTGSGAVKGLAGYKLTLDPITSKSRLTFAWTNLKRLTFPGTPAVSSNGGEEGIVWVIDANKSSQHMDQGGAGSLHAYDALTGHELYSSTATSLRDGLGVARKFSTPVIANGRVYLNGGGTGSVGVAAYGLLPMPGDLNDDGVVDLKDATLSLEAYVGILKLTPTQSGAADVNGDGAIDLKDSTLILLKAVGL